MIGGMLVVVLMARFSQTLLLQLLKAASTGIA